MANNDMNSQIKAAREAAHKILPGIKSGFDVPPNYFKARGTALTAIEADMLAHGTPNKMAKECAELGLSVGLVAIDESRPDYGVALTTQTTQSCLNKGRQR